ncbi:hypothetical protein L2E82_25668 [Cichorium intybus]|uniref:Uncharacterized protein n=1 Tax=Cichorium intybus TaxID=13427 RepID=A0ACB9E3Q0_CICIN|nr:hypothetical protein L2E82_25668 [Cichorium intybus]
MDHIVQQTRMVVDIDPRNNTRTVKQEKVWNYTIADIIMLAFGTSFPQISLATIDVLRNIGQLYAGGMEPECDHFWGGLVDSAAI